MSLPMRLPEPEDDANDQLRIGFLLDSYIVPAWAGQLIADIKSCECVQITCVLLSTGSSDTYRPKKKLKNWLYSRYVEWDSQRVRLPDDPLKPVDVSRILLGVPVTESAAGLDVLISLTSGRAAALPPAIPQYGLWFIHHGDPERYAGVPPYFWEIYDRTPVSGTAVMALHNHLEQGAVFYKAFSSTEQGWSLRKNGAVPYWRASASVVSCLHRLRQGCEFMKALENEPAAQLPTNSQVLRFLSRNVARTVSRCIRYANQELYWFIAYRTDPTKFVANTDSVDPAGFHVIEAPPEHFYADPFALRWNGQNCIFIEDYSYAKQKGCIAVLRMDETGRLDAAETVLERPYHLSYPFVFEHEGAVYMIPETLDANRIEIYRATQMPARWEFVAVLKDGVRAVDTTLWIEDGLFYFFTNIAGRGVTVNDDLFLFHAETLLGEWRPHPYNPVCADVRRSRSAGKLFRRKGKLIRPGQDCSVRYGYACQLHEIEVLSPDDYRERPIARIEPDWYPGLMGTHTINSNENIEVIDGQTNRRKRRASA